MKPLKEIKTLWSNLRNWVKITLISLAILLTLFLFISWSNTTIEKPEMVLKTEIKTKKDSVKTLNLTQSKKEQVKKSNPSRKSWDGHTPFGPHDTKGYLKYYTDNDGIGGPARPYITNEKKRWATVPPEILLAKIWHESHGGHSPLAKKDPTQLLGIKGRNGVKGYDGTDKENVQYKSYPSRFHCMLDFTLLLAQVKGKKRSATTVYQQRFIDWKKIPASKIAQNYNVKLATDNPNNIQPDWWYWSLAMQAHPELKKSKMAYAQCGCTKREMKNGIKESCRQKRLAHARKLIKWIIQYQDIFNTYYIKYHKKYHINKNGKPYIRLKAFKLNNKYYFSLVTYYDWL